MRLLFILIAFVCSHTLLAQEENEIIFAEKHCSITPPKSFKIAQVKGSTGLVNRLSKVAIIVEYFPISVNGIYLKMLSDELEGYLSDGKMEKAVLNNGTPAYKFNLTSKKEGYSKFIYLFGDTEHTVILIGAYPTSQPHFEDVLVSVMQTANLLNGKLDDLSDMEMVDGMFSITTTEYQPLLQKKGKAIFFKKSKKDIKPSIFKVDDIRKKVVAKNFKNYAMARFRELPMSNETVISKVNAIEIEGMLGYEIISHSPKGSKKNTSTNEEAVGYMVILFKPDNGYFLMRGMTYEQHSKNLKSFKQMGKSFKVKMQKKQLKPTPVPKKVKPKKKYAES
ncbi:hypothetical protein [Flammeovirga sp. EKP202]|uniref:hypothetical protein n=1 Tax=Flammeovirga sp. EKP202 TaxID=2770592 RepID=UPI00165F3FEC|nr:hypothetical protein [Flammeovirga sp. EKP202]MBD0400461.1 hypothetical protein [Flammeovirga sp. EKP202]